MKITKKILYVPLIVAALLALPAIGVAVWGFPVDHCRPAVTAELSRLSGMHCTIGAIKMSLRELRVHDTAFAARPQAQSLGRIGTVRVKLDWELFKALCAGRPLTLQEFTAENVFVDFDQWQNVSLPGAASRPAAAAPEVAPGGKPRTPVTAADLASRPAENSLILPKLQVLRCRMRNVKVRMRGVEMRIADISGQRDASGMSFTARGAIDKGQISCKGNLQLFAEDGLLQARQIEASFHLDGLPTPVFYRLFPATFDFLKKQGNAAGDIDISYSWQGMEQLSFSGTVKTADVVAYLFDQDVPVPASMWNFAGSYTNGKLLIDNFALKGEVDDFHLDGYADFVKDNQVFKISSSGLSFPLVCLVAGDKTLARQMRGLVHFDGFVSVNHDEVEVKGKGGSDGLIPQYYPLNTARRITGNGDFSYKSADRIIHLRNVDLSFGFGKAFGALQFPWLKEISAGDLTCDLTVESELAPLSKLFGLELGGKVFGKVEISSRDNAEMRYLAELQGVQAVSAKFRNGENLDIGMFRFSLAGSSFWKEERHILEKILIDTTPLQGRFQGQHAAGRTILDFSLRAQPRAFWPFWVHELHGQINPSALGAMTLSGRGELSPEQTFTFSNLRCQGTLARGEQAAWNYNLSAQGNVALQGEGQYRIDSGVLTLAADKQNLARVNFRLDGSSRPADNSAPQTNLQMLVQTRLPYLRELARLLNFPFPFSALEGGALAANSQIIIRKDAPTEYRVGVNLAEARTSSMMQKQQIAFQGILEDRSRVDGNLLIKNCHFRTADRGLEVLGNGKIFALENPQIAFSLQTHANLEKGLQSLNINLPLKISGMVDSKVEISGAMNHPEFLIDGTAPNIVLDDGTRLRRLDNPKIQARYSYAWNHQNNEISAVKIPQGQIITRDWRLQFSAQAEKLLYRAGTMPFLSFGRGMACNYRFIGKRAFLSWFLPELATLVSGAPDTPESLSSRGVIRAKVYPLVSAGNYQMFRNLQIADGLTHLDHLRAGPVALKNITIPYELSQGVFTANAGKADCGGTCAFNAQVDFTKGLPRGKLQFSSSNLDITQMLNTVNDNVKITAGRVSVPANSGDLLTVTWEGDSLPAILNTLRIPEFSLRVDGLGIRMRSQPVDWEEMLKYDFHQSVAKEIARHLTEVSAQNAGKPLDLRIRQTLLQGRLAERVLNLNSGIITGENTADAKCAGQVGFNRQLRLRIWPTGNMERLFDIDAVFSQATVRDFVRSLPESSRVTARRMIPDWLNNLAGRNKLYADVHGTLDDAQVDLRGMRDGIKAALPELISRVVALVGQSSIVTDIFGTNGLKNSGQNGKPLINLDDLLK